MADIKREDILMYLENANMLEISELIKDIEDKFGVTAAAPVAIAGGAALSADGGADAVEDVRRRLRRLAVPPPALREALQGGERRGRVRRRGAPRVPPGGLGVRR